MYIMYVLGKFSEGLAQFFGECQAVSLEIKWWCGGEWLDGECCSKWNVHLYRSKDPTEYFGYGIGPSQINNEFNCREILTAFQELYMHILCMYIYIYLYKWAYCKYISLCQLYDSTSIILFRILCRLVTPSNELLGVAIPHYKSKYYLLTTLSW